ncbi:hypothetical protein ACH5RR_040963 [Cinchona calisaya]|uniref:Uncharacterized protein n=1 Tax=Cinchona calisaya TaxID=153742 RepID=A0ABD2XSP2_9GENT
MRALQRLISHISINPSKNTNFPLKNPILFCLSKPFSSNPPNNGTSNDNTTGWGSKNFGATGDDNLGWDVPSSSWSTGLTKEHFDGEVVGQQVSPGQGPNQSPALTEYGLGGRGGGRFGPARWTDEEMMKIRELEAENRKGKAFVEGWGERMKEMSVLMKQVREPGARGSYLKDSEKAEMYKKHKENPEVYTVEKLAKEYRIMRQRVHAILWLKELEEEEEKKLGHKLDDSVELLLDTCPEFFNSHDREFHIASLPYKPDFKVMPEDWDGTT